MEDNNETKEAGKSTVDTGTGDKPEAVGLIDRANQAAERLEKANAHQEKLQSQQAELIAKQALGGSSEGGARQLVKVEETPVEYMKKVLSGKLD